MANRNPARFLVPLALVVALVGVVVVVQASRPDNDDTAQTTSTVKSRPRRGVRRPARRSYVVKAGDNLTVIAERTGVTVDVIQRLNPDLDAQALRVGQRLRLR